VEVIINGEVRNLPEGTSLLDLLATVGRDPRTVAVEYNGAILPRHRFEAVILAPRDRLEIVHFVQGG